MIKKINSRALAKAGQSFLFNETPFLFELREKMQQERPYQGLKILHNAPLTLITVLKIECLVLGGAQVTLGNLRSIKPHQDALAIINEAGLQFLTDDSKEEFDVHLDCCAELSFRQAPHLGAIELTQSGDVIYRNVALSYPVISIDNSPLKRLETISTGESFVRAILNFTEEDIFGKNFIVFGYGKVGKGVVRALQEFTKNLVVIESDDLLLENLAKSGIVAISIKNKTAIKQAMKTAFCIVTATGVAAVISQHFEKSDLGTAFLANLGVEDEFGPKFQTQDVLFAKQPINFSLARPTALRYLDPVFYAHNIAIDVLLAKKIPNGYSVFPAAVAQAILEKWIIFHKEQLPL